MTIIKHQCPHCEAQWNTPDTDKKLYCGDCSTSEKRKEMDDNNIKHFAENGLVYQPPIL